MKDSWRKLFIYFLPLATYWRLAPDKLISADGAGSYPTDLAQRLAEGHYDLFDREGLPLRRSKQGGQLFYNYTTVCSYALANWQRFLTTGDEAYADILLKAAQFITTNGQRKGEALLLLDRPGSSPSAMNQGEAISVLVRAWRYSGEAAYLQAAENCLIPYTRHIGEGGVAYPFMGNEQILWYEEYTALPVRHVLNGMIYALWGLRDLALAAANPLAKSLFKQGVAALETALPHYDNGYWTVYCVSAAAGRCHVASMMYHNLHVVQLTALGRQTNNAVLLAYADKFDRYGRGSLNRLRAAIGLVKAKLGISN